MRDNMLHEICRITLIYFNIIFLFIIYINSRKGKNFCMLNMSIILLIKGINMYINKLDTEFISLLVIRIGFVSLLFAEYDIYI